MSRQIPKKELHHLGFHIGLGMCTSAMVSLVAIKLVDKALDLFEKGFQWLIN